MATDEKILKNAQYRKAAPMAFLNSRNTAMEMVKMEGMILVKKKGAKKATGTLSVLQRVKTYTNDLMKDYAEFYSREVASVGGKNYDTKDAIGKLMATTNYPELSQAWMALSADEKADDAIIKVAQELKAKFTKNEKA